VFKSIIGYYWFLRLRGHEIDAIDFGRKSFGQQYALGQKTDDMKQLSRLIMKLCEKTGRRLRAHGSQAYGIHLWLNFENRTYWAHGAKTKHALYSTRRIFICRPRSY
jgi:DNA polymerase IV